MCLVRTTLHLFPAEWPTGTVKGSCCWLRSVTKWALNPAPYYAWAGQSEYICAHAKVWADAGGQGKGRHKKRRPWHVVTWRKSQNTFSSAKTWNEKLTDWLVDWFSVISFNNCLFSCKNVVCTISTERLPCLFYSTLEGRAKFTLTECRHGGGGRHLKDFFLQDNLFILVNRFWYWCWRKRKSRYQNNTVFYFQMK